jgi:type I restriction enzyme S subunit
MRESFRRLDDLVALTRSAVTARKDPTLPYIGLEHLKSGRSTLIGMADASDSVSTNFAFENGDILFGKLRPNLKKSVRVDRNGYCSTDLLVLRARNDVDPSFAGWVMRSEGVFAEAARTAEGTKMPRTSWSRLKHLTVFAPSRMEQQRIAEILDTIDRLISSIKTSVAKHAQVRLAHVRKMMAEGLCILQALEASELSSLGSRDQGPWFLAPLGIALTRIEAGNSPSVEDTPAGPGEWGVLKVSAVGRSGFRSDENKVAHDGSLHIESLCVRPGDLLITRANTAELVGMTCIVRETPPGLMLCDKTLRLHVDDTFTSTKYVQLVLTLAEVRAQIEIAATGTSGSMKNISQASIRRLVIPWSEKTTMDHVVRVDAGYAAQIDALMQQAQRLTLLKQGLMEDLLTGRVRVSEAEAVLENL